MNGIRSISIDLRTAVEAYLFTELGPHLPPIKSIRAGKAGELDIEFGAAGQPAASPLVVFDEASDIPASAPDPLPTPGELADDARDTKRESRTAAARRRAMAAGDLVPDATPASIADEIPF